MIFSGQQLFCPTVLSLLRETIVSHMSMEIEHIQGIHETLVYDMSLGIKHVQGIRALAAQSDDAKHSQLHVHQWYKYVNISGHVQICQH